MSSDSFAELGEFLTASEAKALAAQISYGQHIAKALSEIHSSRRQQVKALLAAAGLSHDNPEQSVAVLNAIAGAKSLDQSLVPVWTMPGNEAKFGHLTSEFHRIVGAARQSVVCATYNFETSSQMWTALKDA